MPSRRLFPSILFALLSIQWPHATAQAIRIVKEPITVPGGNCPGPPIPGGGTWTHVPSTPNLVAYFSSVGMDYSSASINPAAMEQECHTDPWSLETRCVFRGLVPGMQYSLTLSTQYSCFGGSASLSLLEAVDCNAASLLGPQSASCEFWQVGAMSLPYYDFGEVAFGDSAETTFTLYNSGGTTLNETLMLDCSDYSIVGSPVVSVAPGQVASVTVRYSPTINDTPLGVLSLTCDRVFLVGSGIGPRVLWHDADEIGRARVDGTLVESITSSAAHVDFAVDFASGTVYRAESDSPAGRIMVSGFLSEGTPIVSGGQPWSVAFDAIAAKVYWVDAGPGATGNIIRMNPDGSMTEAVPINYDALNPPDIAVDPHARQIYWTVRGATNAIWRANLDDGSNQVPIVTFAGGGDPQIALDPSAGRIYWSEGSSIRRAHVDGTNVQTLLTPGIVSAGALAVDPAARQLFWADVGTSSIHCVDLDGSNPMEIVTGLTGSTGLALILPPRVPERIYWVDVGASAIQSMRKDGTGASNLFAGNPNLPLAPIDVALDASTGKLYWLDLSTRTLHRGDENGNPNSVEDLVIDLSGPQGLALDEQGGKVYWTEAGGPDQIRRANLNGSGAEQLIGSELSGVGDIALDPTAGKMYWTEAGRDGIYRANLNGSGAELVIPGLASPLGIALDTAAGKVYWTDDRILLADRIQRANLDGSAIENLVTGPMEIRYLALDLEARKMYWSEPGVTLLGNLSATDTGSIWRANMDGSGVEIVITGLSSPGGIAVAVGVDYPLTSGIDDLAPRPRVLLEAPRPNPFNPNTMISFVHGGGTLDLAIYDARGRLVRTLVAGHEPPDRRTVVWDGKDDRGMVAPSGLYLVRLRSQSEGRTVKAVLVR